MDPDHVTKIARILYSDEYLVKNWVLLKDQLLPAVSSLLIQSEHQFKNGSITTYELLRNILQLWISTQGSLATVENLCKILNDLRFKSVREKIETAFDNAELFQNAVGAKSGQQFETLCNSVQNWLVVSQNVQATRIVELKKFGPNGKLAIDILQMMAYFVPEGIRVELIIYLKESSLDCGNEDERISKILMALETLNSALLIRITINNTISMHADVQEAARIITSTSGSELRLLRNYIESVQKIVKELTQSDILHIIALWKFSTAKYTSVVNDYPNFAFKICKQLNNISIYNEVQSFSMTNYTLIAKVFASSHIETLKIEERSAYAMMKNRKYREVLERLNILLSKCKEILGEEHKLTFLVTLDIASVLYNLSRYDEALSLYEAVLEAKKRVLGENNASTLAMKRQVALLLISRGYIKEAMGNGGIYTDVLEWKLKKIETAISKTKLPKNSVGIESEDVEKLCHPLLYLPLANQNVQETNSITVPVVSVKGKIQSASGSNNLRKHLVGTEIDNVKKTNSSGNLKETHFLKVPDVSVKERIQSALVNTKLPKNTAGAKSDDNVEKSLNPLQNLPLASQNEQATGSVKVQATVKEKVKDAFDNADLPKNSVPSKSDDSVANLCNSQQNPPSGLQTDQATGSIKVRAAAVKEKIETASGNADFPKNAFRVKSDLHVQSSSLASKNVQATGSIKALPPPIKPRHNSHEAKNNLDEQGFPNPILDLKKLDPNGELAIDILQMMAYFEPDEIRVPFIINLRESSLDCRNQTERISKIQNALEMLKSALLITINNNIISIHAKAQEAQRLTTSITNDELTLLKKYIGFAKKITKKLEKQDIRHIISLWNFSSDKYTSVITDYPSFAFKISNQLKNISLYNEMQSFSIKNYTLLEKVLGSSHLETLQMKEGWASALESNGKYVESLEKYEILLSKCKTILGEEHELTMLTSHNMADVLFSLERFDEAVSLYKSVLELEKKVYGENHAETMRTKYELASVLSSKGQIQEALSIHAEVLEWEECNYGAEDSLTLYTIHSIASCHYDLKEFEKAKEMFTSLLQTRIKVLGEEHSETLDSKYTLAQTLCELGETEAGLRMMRQVLVSRENVLGPQHPDTIITRNNISYFT